MILKANLLSNSALEMLSGNATAMNLLRSPTALSLSKRERESHKKQIKASAEFIDDVMKSLQQLFDYLGTDNDVKRSQAALRLTIEIMQHRCEDVIAGIEAAGDTSQRSMLTSTPWKGTCNCAVYEDHLYN